MCFRHFQSFQDLRKKSPCVRLSGLECFALPFHHAPCVQLPGLNMNQSRLIDMRFLLCQDFEPVATDQDMLPSWFGWRACSQCFGISIICPLVLKFVLPFAVLSVAFAALIFADVSSTFGVLWVALILACLGGASPLGMAHLCSAFGTPLVACLAALFLLRWWFIFGTFWTCSGFGLLRFALPVRHTVVMLLRLTSVLLAWMRWNPSFDFVPGHLFAQTEGRLCMPTLLQCDFAFLPQLCLRVCGLCLFGSPYHSYWSSPRSFAVKFLFYQFAWFLALPTLTLRLTPTGPGCRNYNYTHFVQKTGSHLQVDCSHSLLTIEPFKKSICSVVISLDSKSTTKRRKEYQRHDTG